MDFEVPAGAKAWLIVFHTQSTWWVERLCPGPWKHVTAVGFVPDAQAWIGLSWELGRLRVCVVPEAKFDAWFATWIGPEAGILRAAAPDFDRGPWRPRAGLFCTSLVSHLLGLRFGALLPGGLWRLLIANGAEIVSHGRPIQSESKHAGTDGEREGSTVGG